MKSIRVVHDFSFDELAGTVLAWDGDARIVLMCGQTLLTEKLQ